MKANELMIGDLVYCNGKVVMIDSIIPDSKQLIAGGELFSYVFNDGIYEPIPLTEDMLNANGFRESIEEGTYYFPHQYEELHVRGFAVETDGEGRWMITDHQLIVFRYVHELQHALRLCGLNELADNFKLK